MGRCCRFIVYRGIDIESRVSCFAFTRSQSIYATTTTSPASTTNWTSRSSGMFTDCRIRASRTRIIVFFPPPASPGLSAPPHIPSAAASTTRSVLRNMYLVVTQFDHANPKAGTAHRISPSSRVGDEDEDEGLVPTSAAKAVTWLVIRMGTSCASDSSRSRDDIWSSRDPRRW